MMKSCVISLKLNRELFFCVAIGLWAGLVIGFVTEYYTSNAYRQIIFAFIYSFAMNLYHLLL